MPIILIRKCSKVLIDISVSLTFQHLFLFKTDLLTISQVIWKENNLNRRLRVFFPDFFDVLSVPINGYPDGSVVPIVGWFARFPFNIGILEKIKLFKNTQCTSQQWGNGDKYKDHLKTANIWIPNFLKLRFQMFKCFVLFTNSTIEIPDQYIRKLDGVHLSGIQVVRLSSISPCFRFVVLASIGRITNPTCGSILLVENIVPRRYLNRDLSLHSPYLVTIPFGIQPLFNYLNTKQVWYSDPHCTTCHAK